MRWTDPLDGRPQRHARVWLAPATWSAAIVRVAPDDRDVLAAWIDAGRPLVACRRDPSLGHACCLAIGLPARRRIGLVVDARAVRRSAAPLRLVDVVATAPIATRPALHDLIERGRRVSAHFHVYGSFAWQAISGDACVTATSDLDLLWTAPSLERVDRVVAALRDWEAEHGLRADGELLTADGGGIAWRELAAHPARVLVKHADRVALHTLDALFPSPQAARAPRADRPAAVPHPAERTSPPPGASARRARGRATEEGDTTRSSTRSGERRP